MSTTDLTDMTDMNVSSFEDSSFDQSFQEDDGPLSRSTSRQNSASSLPGINGGLQLTDDDDDTTDAFKNYKDRRRNAHTAAEQKRRDAIKITMRA